MRKLNKNTDKLPYLYVIYACMCLFVSGLAQAQSADWPRDLKIDSGVLTIYQPQIDNMEDGVVQFRAAVSYRAEGSDTPVFGATWLESRVETDRQERTVRLATMKVTDSRFPEGSEHVKAEFAKAVKEGLPKWDLVFSLDDLLTSLEASEKEISAANNLNMDPPKIVYRDHPALLISIDGDPVLREIENSPYEAVINTPYPLIVDTKRNKYYLNAARDVWYSARESTGPFKFLAKPPEEIVAMLDQTEMEDSDEVISAANAPEIVVATEQTELIVSDGKAQFEPLVDDLLVISNSTSDVFMHVSEQQYFIVISGRWYQSSSMEGPWAYVASADLPDTFKQIPADSRQGGSRVYVAGTDEAREAVMDAHIPQTAAVNKGRVDIEVSYDGEPKFVSIQGNSLQYAENTASTVLKSGSDYYLVEDAVWYIGTGPAGPWDVAESRPDDVDGLPPESPVYNVKYVYIYETTPELVYVGYTPGYTGSYVYHTTVVYGTGWYYRPWISANYYYPRPATWGFHVTYNPWTGWGFGLGWTWGPFTVGFHSGGYWHRHHYWYHRHYGRWGAGGYRPVPVHFGNNSFSRSKVSTREYNLYRDKGQAAKISYTRDTSLNMRTRTHMVNQGFKGSRSKLANRSKVTSPAVLRERAKTPLPALNNNNVFTDKQGNVYRNTDNGWQKREGGSWKESPVAANDTQARGSLSATKRSGSSSRQTGGAAQLGQSSSRQTQAYRSSGSGYNRPSSLERQSYSRQRSSSRNYQYSQQRSTQSRSRTSGGRRR